MLPDKDGYFGIFGGRYVPENLTPPLQHLEETYNDLKRDEEFKKSLNAYLRDYIHRPTPLYFAERLSKYFGLKIYIKREDLIPSGSYKLNNAIGQVFLAKYLNKKEVLAYTESGQNGIAVATAARLFNIPCKVFINREHYKKLGENLKRLKLLECELVMVDEESILDIAMNYWLSCWEESYLIIDSVIGPHPYPMIVRDFQSIVGKEARKQIIEKTGKLPDYIISSMRYGTNALGLFFAFLDDNANLIGVLNTPFEPKDELELKIDVRFGSKCFSATGYENVVFGPEISFYVENAKLKLGTVNSELMKEAYKLLVKHEAIFTSLNSVTSLAYLLKIVDKVEDGDIILLNITSFTNSKDLEVL